MALTIFAAANVAPVVVNMMAESAARENAMVTKANAEAQNVAACLSGNTTNIIYKGKRCTVK